MKFNKKDLGFLKIFDSVSDGQKVTNDKLRIRTKDGKVYFSLFSAFGAVIHVLERDDIKKDFEVIFPIKSFYSFVKLLKEDEVIEILEGKIKVGKDSEYQFEDYKITLDNEIQYLDIIKKKPNETFILKDLNTFKIVKDFAGKDELATVGVYSDSLLASNKILACIFPSSNELNKNIDVPLPLISLMNSFDQDEISLSHYNTDGKDFYYFDLMGIHVCSAVQKFALPNLLSDDLKAVYDHKSKAVVNKDTLISILDKMRIVASLNVDSRIHFSFEKNKIKIENKDYNKSFDYLDTEEIDNSLVGASFLLNCELLSKLLSYFKGSRIFIYAENDKDLIAIRLEDDLHKFQLIQVLTTI